MNALSDYQKNVLSHIGISQWQLRSAVQDGVNEANIASGEIPSNPVNQLAALKESLTPAAVANSVAEPAPQSTPITTPSITSEAVIASITDVAHPIVQDVLLALDVSHIEIQTKAFIWQVGDTISLEAKRLITPELAQLSVSPDLKKQLWHQLQQWQK